MCFERGLTHFCLELFWFGVPSQKPERFWRNPVFRNRDNRKARDSAIFENRENRHSMNIGDGRASETRTSSRLQSLGSHQAMAAGTHRRIRAALQTVLQALKVGTAVAAPECRRAWLEISLRGKRNRDILLTVADLADNADARRREHRSNS
jgi:hypothetical protein